MGGSSWSMDFDMMMMAQERARQLERTEKQRRERQIAGGFLDLAEKLKAVPVAPPSPPPPTKPPLERAMTKIDETLGDD